MTKIVLNNISIYCWVLYPNVDSLLYSPDQIPVLPSYNAEIVGIGIMYCLLDVHLNRRGSL